jgi:hypothetical protein
MTDREPLWKAMHQADVSVTKTTGPILSRHMYAAELRAIAEWLFKQGSLDEVAARADTIKLLFDEADRAEASHD